MKVLSDERQAQIASKEPDPASFAEKRDSISRVMQTLEGLPGPQEEAIRLKFHQGLKYREIGEVMEISASNVGFLIHQGINSLREELSSHHPGLGRNHRRRCGRLPGATT